MTTGMNALTGRTISDWDHLVQSLGKILTTTLRTRVMRRNFGMGKVIDVPLSPATLLDFYAETAKAIALEPRIRPTRIWVDGSDAANGHVTINIEGVYYPNALKGDFGVSLPKKASVAISR